MNEGNERVVVLCTVPSAAEGVRVARALVEERLAACVSLVERVRSIYAWEGEVCDENECLLVIKTRAERFELLATRIVELHPYDVPEVIATPIVAGHAPYLQWVDESVGS